MILLSKIHSCEQAASKLFAEHMGTDLTVRQAMVLVAVNAASGAHQTALVNATGIDRSTISEMIRRMHTKGLLERKRSKADERAYEVKLTPQGQKVLRQATASAAKAEKALLELVPQAKHLNGH